MQHIINAFALAGAGLASVASTQIQPSSDIHLETIDAPKLELANIQMEWPTQEEMVNAEVSNFRMEFARRVRSNDYSGQWNRCFSTKYADYNPADAKILRANSFRFFKTGSFTDNQPIVVIDMGHGHEAPIAEAGYDTGGDRPGFREAKLVEPVGMELKEQLEDMLGAIVVMTRLPVSSGLTLGQQTSMFKNQKVALQVRAELTSHLATKFPNSEVVFISLHTNTGNNPGSEIYYYAPYKNGPTDSPEAKRLAQTINAHYRLRPGAPGYALSNDHAVTRCQKVPSVLAELGSIDVGEDRKALQNPKSIATQIANGFKAYFDESYKARAVYADAQKWTKPVQSMVLASNEP